ncbi:hypothetical protein HPFOLIGI_01725 [Mannheimia haemolytica]
MSVLNDVKKTAQRDWHKADILAELRKKVGHFVLWLKQAMLAITR